MMSRLKSAADLAAAIPFAAFLVFYAAPSRAWELDPPPAISPETNFAGETQPVGTDPDDLPAAAAAPAPVALPQAPADLPALPPTPRSLVELVDDHAASRTADAEHECLANAVYFESKGEPLRGQLSVAEVVVNRARSGRFPKSLCGVVKQRGQFSFVKGGRLPRVPRASLAWRKAVAIAHIARQDLADGAAPRALFFHAKRVSPSWRGLRRVAAVGNHIFYR